MKKKFSKIIYRPSLINCNYECSYCVFKRKSNKEEKVNFSLLIEIIEKNDNDVEVMLASDGELLVNEKYFNDIKRLVNNRYVKSIGIQTNGSFNLDKFLLVFDDKMIQEKINLWITYHPTQVSYDIFLNQVRNISTFFKLSVGCVYDKKTFKLIKKLYSEIPDNIYLWLNKNMHNKKMIHGIELNEILEVDPLFNLENSNNRCDYEKCLKDNNTIFIDENFKFNTCLNSLKIEKGREMYCDCYLTYCTQKAKVLNYLDNTLYRQSSFSNNISTIFFDIDQTLIDNGISYKKTVEIISVLSRYYKLYFITALPIITARKKTKELWNYFSGGVFASGGHIYLNELNYNKYFTFEHDYKDYYREYTSNQKSYKLIFKSNIIEDSALRCTIEDGFISLSKNNKYDSLLFILNKLSLLDTEILVVGNGLNDYDIIKNLPYSIALNHAEDCIKDNAMLTCSFLQICSLLKKNKEKK